MLRYRLRTFLLWTIVAGAALFQSCKDDEPEVIETGQDLNFFPLAVGYTWIYEVDSIFYDGFSLTSDTFQFEIRNTVFDTLTDNLGRLAHVVIREKDTGSGWTFDRQFMMVKTDDEVEVIDQDIRVVKMIFPVRTYKRWDGNVFNTRQGENFRYRDIDEPITLLDTSYDSSARVIEEDYNNVLQDYYKTSVYVRRIGLVEFYYRNIDRKNSSGEFIQGSVSHYRLKKFEN